MSRIKILSKEIYNRIAAGEVVDRPYSAVKELIENSLDAKATEIEIYIERGGKQLIKVVDNGCGIERDDLRSAFFPHATSKISCAEDLDKIMTLGFRGEALASISAIAKVEIISCAADKPAYSITCDGGVIGEITPSAIEKGTQICVRDLFYNTPARAKFMKADKKEESDITNFVTRYVLGNPQVSFKYYVDGRLKLQSYGEGLDEAVAQVYGSGTVASCFKIDAVKDDIHIYGFIGNQNYFKPNKTYQSTFLNGRYIVNNTIATAISNAYASYAMRRQYPFYVLFIEVPTEFVDVNVHPNKADVRFIDNRIVFGAVYSVISSVLDGTAKAKDFVIESTRIPEIKSTAEQEAIEMPDGKELMREDGQGAKNGVNTADEMHELMEKYKPYKPEYRTNDSVEVLENALNLNAPPQEKPIKKDYSRFDPLTDIEINDLFPDSGADSLRVTSNTMPIDPSNTEVYGLDGATFGGLQQKIDYDSYIFKGNLFNTYLLYEYRDDIYIIDQHAAHERLIYDRLCKQFAENSNRQQPLLCPYTFRVTPDEREFIEDKLPSLRKMGFSISPFGSSSYRIDMVPVDLRYMNAEQFMQELLSQVNSLKDVTAEDVFKDKIAMTACKHAIKGGQNLSEEEAVALLKQMDGNMGLKCPHGRPVCAVLSKREIEKMFKRIV